MSEWQKTQYAGVRFRNHSSRRHNGHLDRYFTIRYKRGGKTVDEATGWASEGMNAQKASNTRAEITHNIRHGLRPQSLADKRAMEDERQQAEQVRLDEETRDSFTFGELADRYIEWAKGNKKSWRDDEQRYKTHLKPVLAAKPLSGISPFLLEQLKVTLKNKQPQRKTSMEQGKEQGKGKKTLSDSTVKHCLALVRQIFNKANAWGLFSGANPIKQVKLPKANNRRLRFLSYDEAAKLLKVLAVESSTVHDQAFLSMHTGMRFSEIASLTWNDLDLTHNVINIRDPKSGEGRQCSMDNEVQRLLVARKPEGAKPTALVFPSRNGKLQKAVSNTFDKVVTNLGLNNGGEDRQNKVVFHTIRHTFGSWLAMAGVPIFTIKELMGHKSIEMTTRYAHLAPDHKREALEGLAHNFREVRNKNLKENSACSIKLRPPT